jgi:hypothetical protein
VKALSEAIRETADFTDEWACTCFTAAYNNYSIAILESYFKKEATNLMELDESVLWNL